MTPDKQFCPFARDFDPGNRESPTCAGRRCMAWQVTAVKVCGFTLTSPKAIRVVLDNGGADTVAGFCRLIER